MAKPRRRLQIDIPDKVEPEITPSGTFKEDDIRINTKGLQIGEVEKYVGELVDLGEILGKGTSAIVKKVLHKPTNQFLALKVIPLDVNEEIRKKILLELRTLHRCDHESIVAFYGAFYREGAISVAIEYMEGGTLAELLKKTKTIPEPILGKFAVKLLQGLDYIHRELNIIHRDIKPSNLLLNTETIKITDFGVSGQLSNTLKQKQTFVGTITYMSPERIVGQPHSSNCDIWSLGLTLLECAIGYYPYVAPGTQCSFTFFELLEKIKNQAPPLPPADKFSPEFCDFIKNCLQRDQRLRPEAKDLLEHPWIKKYEKEQVDLSCWLKSVLKK